MDNFRSPQRVVHMINKLGLTPEPVLARSAHAGDLPHFHIWETGQSSAQGKLNECLAKLWQSGYKPDQVAVISYRGVQQSEALRQDSLGGHATRRFTSQYDSAGNAQWSEGPLLAESLYRFKGQSAPAVVLCEVDFETLTERDKRKLFVGLTRAQMRVDVVISEQAARALFDML
jgi:superfamily I DNA and RNA helicase